MSIILIKNNKGGVGKSWITLQLAHATQIATEKKVLILTTDNQNNILNYSGAVHHQFHGGLEQWIQGRDAEIIQVKPSVYFIPLMSDFIATNQREKLKKFINKKKEEFDYIFIDSTPTLSLDKDFIELADNIIVPTYLDDVTTASIVKLIKAVGGEKIKAIVPNRYNNTSNEKKYFKDLSKILEDYEIFVSDPIPQTSKIGILISRGKTVWESKAKETNDIRNIIISICKVIL